MAKIWKSWDEQGRLKEVIRSLLDTRRSRETLVCTATGSFHDKNGQPWTPEEVNKAIDELIADWLVINRNDGWLQLTEESRESLVQATQQGDYPGAMMFLFEKGVWHPDMERFGLTDSGETASEATAKAQQELTDQMVTMPDGRENMRVEKAQCEAVTYNEVPDGAKRITSAITMATVETFKDEKYEFSIQEIREHTPKIDPVELAVELGGWIATNVEQFIDNQETIFRMYLCVKSDMGMPVSSMCQRLYLSVPDVDDGKGITGALVDALYDALDSKLIKAKELLCADAEFQAHLFERMAFFYELTGVVVKDGKVSQALTQKMQGRVSINELVFDPISLTTTVSQGVGKHEGGKVREGKEKVVVKKEEMPAGYGIEIEISLSPKGAIPLAMY